MKYNWPKSFAYCLLEEGGFVNHPKDPGGVTNLGVTKRVWESWTGRHVTEQEMRNLKPKDVEPLYKKHYWEAVTADELPSGVDYAAFDYAVNSGVNRSARYIQRIVGAVEDGELGPKSLAAVRAYIDVHGAAGLINALMDARLTFLKKQKTWGTFGKGWEARIDKVRKRALAMSNLKMVVNNA